MDWASLNAVLIADGMASIGVREHIGDYVLAKDSALHSVGCAGLEHQSDVGVLRSVVVSLPHRGHGLGSLFIAKLICYAKRASLRHAVLVTDRSGARFAAKFGFHEALPECVPEAGHRSSALSSRAANSVIMYRSI